MAFADAVKFSVAVCGILTVVTAGLLVSKNGSATIDLHQGHPMAEMNHQQIEDNLRRRFLVLPQPEAITPPALQTSEGTALNQQLAHAWSLVFFGFTSCPDVCPRTLSILAKAAQDYDSGIESGDTQVLFISVDPGTDSLERITAYLGSFDSRFVGYTGLESQLANFAAQLGASYREAGQAFDHSTSIYVVDPMARVQGLLLSPSSSSQLIADFHAIRTHSLQQETHWATGAVANTQ